MKNRKLIALLVAFVLIFTQFSMLGIVSAETTALTGREGFLKGITIQTSKVSSDAYTKAYDAILDAAPLGVNIIRHKIIFDNDNFSYDIGRADLAARYGMQMLAIAPIAHYDQENECILPVDQIDVDAITTRFKGMAATLKGKVAYYQLDNELNNNVRLSESKTNGMDASVFNTDDIQSLAVALYAANKGIKEGDPNAQTVINISWQHVGYIDALRAVKLDADTGRVATDATTNVTYLDWDVIGLDWYSNGDNPDFKENGFWGDTIDYDYVIEELIERNPDKPIIVCEANIRPLSENADGTIEYCDDPSWIADFANYCYGKEEVIGFFAFELYDEPQFSKDSEGNHIFNTEAYYGLIDKDGNKKPTYEVVRSLFGGTGMVADRTIASAPEMNNEGEVKAVFQTEMVTVTLPRVYSENILTLENTNGVNFKNGDLIEFDFYVEDAKAFMAAMSRLDINFNIMVSTNGVDVIRECRYVPTNYILKDGWNHFKVARSAFFERTSTTADVDWGNINKVILKFNSSNLHNFSELAGMKLAVANLCSTDVAIPENQAENKVVIDKEGRSGVSERRVNSFVGYEYKVLSSDVDISSCEKIEFDLYVDNLENFEIITKDFPLHLRLISNDKNNEHCRYNLSEYVTKQGWNHIEIDINSHFSKTSGFNFASVKKYRLHFNGEPYQDPPDNKIPTPMPYAATYIMFKNFNGVLDEYGAVPNIVESKGMLTIHKGAKYAGTLGTYSDVIGGEIVYSSNQDFSKYDYFEFDFYVENIDNFKALVSNIRLNLVGSNSSNQLNYKFLDQITENGWNHIKLKASEGVKVNSGSLDAVKIVQFRITKNSDVSVGTEDRFKIANICATKAPHNIFPELPENTVASSTEGWVKTYGDGFNGIRAIAGNLATYPIDYSKADYIEFDIYVENVEHLWDYQTANMNSDAHYFAIFLSSERKGGSDANYIKSSSRVYYRFTEFKDQIKNNGWNHIVTKITDWNKGESGKATASDFSNIGRIGFFTTRGSVSDSSKVYSDEYFGFANVCGTAEEYKIFPELPENTVAASTEGWVKTYGNGYDGIRAIAGNLTTYPIDLSKADLIEFDIYVENVEHFWDYQTANMNSDAHYFAIFLSSERKGGNTASSYITNADYRVYYRFADLKDQITKDGWNHIVTKITDWNKGTSSKAVASDFSNIGRIGFFTTRGSVSDPSKVYSDEYFGFANVCGTLDLRVPTEVMKDKVDFIGAEAKTVTFDDWGSYSEEVNANITGTRMIELDVYVTDGSNSTLTVELKDTSEKYASYEFKNLIKGWNHLAVRISDMETEEGFDFENIVGYTFYGVKDTTVYVANFYAAAYVKGDGNRDGLLDIRDLVAMKKYSVGLALSSGMVGNKVAMDVAGNDYNVNSLDLSELRRYFLTDKWSEN